MDPSGITRLEEVAMANDCMTLSKFLENINADEAFEEEYRAAKEKNRTRKAFFKKYNLCPKAVDALKTKKLKAVEAQLGREQARAFKVIIF
jgi:hypothetical protein